MASERLTQSYTSANAFPAKLLQSAGARSLTPAHVQWLPTNLCNFRCSFCSCSKRDKRQSMDTAHALRVISEFAEYGTQAVTITGGGEPLCHPDLPVMIQYFHQLGIKVGLVTNGVLLSDFPHEILSLVTWCRISNADERNLTTAYRQTLDHATEVPIDWAFSHVVSAHPNLAEIMRIVAYANDHNFTHVRLVGDLLAPEKIDWGPIYEALKGQDKKVIYQPRKEYTPSSRCWLGYIKPVVAPDFEMYLCCGAQYAIDGQTGDFPQDLCMGSALDLASIYCRPKQCFEVACDRCYYPECNLLLDGMMAHLDHPEFV